MINGRINDDFLPIVPIFVKRLDGNWQKLNVICDTGNDGDLVLGRAAVYRHDIAIAPACNAEARIDPKDLSTNSISESRFWVELKWEENPQLVEAKFCKLHKYSGLLGTNLLQYRRLTIDMVRNGVVNIDRVPPPTSHAQHTSQFRTSKMHCHNPEDPSLSNKLPWEEIKIKDVDGKYHTINVNLDTGNNGELTLPPSHVRRFGFRLLNKCRVNVMGREVNASCGDVEVVWQGCHRTVQCIEREDVDRPIIGTKLLSGNQITIYFESTGTYLSITPIGRNSFADRLRQKFAWRERWRK